MRNQAYFSYAICLFGKDHKEILTIVQLFLFFHFFNLDIISFIGVGISLSMLLHIYKAKIHSLKVDAKEVKADKSQRH